MGEVADEVTLEEVCSFIAVWPLSPDTCSGGVPVGLVTDELHVLAWLAQVSSLVCQRGFAPGVVDPSYARKKQGGEIFC